MGLSKLFGVLDVFSELSRLESRDRNSTSSTTYLLPYRLLEVRRDII